MLSCRFQLCLVCLLLTHPPRLYRALKWHYALDRDNQGLGEARSNACEIVAWRFLTRHSEREAVTFCLYEIPDRKKVKAQQQLLANDIEADERAPLLPRVLATFDGSSPSAPAGSSSKKIQLLSSLSRLTNFGMDDDDDDDEEDDPTAAFEGLNALEIAAVANAKRFLSQHVVQKIVSGIWNGDIVFWDTMSVNSSKHPHFYNPSTSDPYSRLRVPKYLKCWEVLFFGVFLCLYYSVLIVRDETRLTGPEIALFFWIAAFFYDELSEWADAGAIFYATDIWNLFDMIMILIGIIFAVLSESFQLHMTLRKCQSLNTNPMKESLASCGQKRAATTWHLTFWLWKPSL